jgi:hypothetical protein
MNPPLVPNAIKILFGWQLRHWLVILRLDTGLAGRHSPPMNRPAFKNLAVKKDFNNYAADEGSCARGARFNCNANFVYFLRADLAMGGSAISILTPAHVAFPPSLLDFFWGIPL